MNWQKRSGASSLVILVGTGVVLAAIAVVLLGVQEWRTQRAERAARRVAELLNAPPRIDSARAAALRSALAIVYKRQERVKRLTGAYQKNAQSWASEWPSGVVVDVPIVTLTGWYAIARHPQWPLECWTYTDGDIAPRRPGAIYDYSCAPLDQIREWMEPRAGRDLSAPRKP